MPEGIERTRWPLISAEEARQVAAALQNAPIFGSDSQQVVGLEEAWRRYADVPYCRAVSSGTSGLHMALWSAGVGPGDEVLVPAYSFMSTALVVLHVGAIPVFVDVQRDTWNIDPARIEAAVTPRAKAIIAVHLNGLPADMNEVNSIAQRHGLAVIEDSAHAPGASYRGRMTGTLGDAAAFSLNGVKNLPAGEAGLFTTRHREFYERAEGLWLRVTLGAPCESYKYHLGTLGYNYRCSVIAAALAREQLLRLDELNARRRANCERLSEQLEEIPGVVAPRVPSDRTHVYHMYRVRFGPRAAGVDADAGEFRAKLVAALGAEGVLCRSWMNWTLPDLPVFSRPDEFERSYPWRRPWGSDRVYRSQDFPEARAVVRETAMVAEAPTAANPEVIDHIAGGFRKVFSRLRDVMRIELTAELKSGDLANCDEIRKALKRASAKRE